MSFGGELSDEDVIVVKNCGETPKKVFVKTSKRFEMWFVVCRVKKLLIVRMTGIKSQALVPG